MPKAVVLTKYGPPDVLVWRDVAMPEPGPPPSAYPSQVRWRESHGSEDPP